MNSFQRPGPFPLVLHFFLFIALAACQPAIKETSLQDDAAFQSRVLELSESGGYFDTDNLISNETSYQHVLDRLQARPGRSYVGVGPGQNFTYIARLRPEIAIILDIRRDNQLFHLYWKELFERAENRARFLSLLLARPLAEDYVHEPGMRAPELLELFNGLPADRTLFLKSFETVWTSLRRRFPEVVLEEDRNRLMRLWAPFVRDGFDLRFASHGRRPRPFYPTFGGLVLATDLKGKRGHYLEREEDYAFLRSLHRRNRLLPVTGDFAGPQALRSIGRYLTQLELPVAAFYLSNVEFYLFPSGAHRAFVSNLRTLPVDSESLLIRSHFGNSGRHPETQPGHFVTCILQSIQSMLRHAEEEPYMSYWDLVMRDFIPVRRTIER